MGNILISEWIMDAKRMREQEAKRRRESERWNQLMAGYGFEVVQNREEFQLLFPIKEKAEIQPVANVIEYAFDRPISGPEAVEVISDQGYRHLGLEEGMIYAFSNPQSLRHKLVCAGSFGILSVDGGALYFPILDRTFWLRKRRARPKLVAFAHQEPHPLLELGTNYRFLVYKKPE